VLDVPEDIAHGIHAFTPDAWRANEVHASIPALRCRPDAASLSRAADLLAAAQRPLILAGGGVHLSGAAETLTAFARSLNIPVAHTMTGKGAIPCIDPLSAGLFGRYDRIANELIGQSDLLLVVGCKLGEIATKRYTVPAPDARLVHLDISAEEFDRTLQPSLRLWGDAREGLRDLEAALKSRAGEMQARLKPYADSVAAAMAAWRKSVAPRLESDETPVAMARMLNEINKALPADGYLVADGGFAAHWGGLLFDTKRAGRSFVPDRGFASIGYGLPGSMGIAMAFPERKVFGLTGDGGFNMMIGELETARRMKLDLTVIVVNNAASGYVKALQHLMYGADAYQSSDLAETNYAKAADALGCTGIRVERAEQMGPALQRAMGLKGPVVIDVVVTRDPAKMLPGVDSRTAQVKKGDRVA
jgi:acetolactate synthase-1/2/3 large subunit